MRKSFPYAAAVLLVAFGPAYAANPPDSDAGKIAIQKEADALPAIHQDDTNTNVIILDQDSLHALPNPYSNPEPRLISDVWAMRT